MSNNFSKCRLAFFLILSFWLIPAAARADSLMVIEQGGLAERVEKAITAASDLHDQGKIPKAQPLLVRVSPEIQLSFSAESFDADLEKAFRLLEQLMSRKQSSPGTSAAVSRPGPIPSSDRITTLMQTERRMPQGAPQEAVAPPLEYSVYKNYQQARQGRLQNEEREIEADRQMVMIERQTAAQARLMQKQREQQLQAQAGKWQEELDKQAKASAQAAWQYQKEHSFGAYAKRFLGMALQTTVGAFTGGFLGTIGTNLADKAVSRLFPAASSNVITQAAAAGTSSAITGTTTAAGQGATGSLTGQQNY